VHDLEERLCRWFLQVRDLLQTDALPLTQEFMANMLGVRRTSLTMVARSLQAAGLIKYRRGRVDVVDVEGLHEAACECYEAINGYYEQLIGWWPAVAEQSRPARIAHSG
jgi:Mn-dependent DtxR family transcriptional regulator